MTNPHHRFLAPWRLGIQWGLTLIALLLPFGRIHGGSLLRLDIDSLQLHLFGSTLGLEDLYLFLLLCLALILLFLFITLLLGRAWCGWACPQTTLCDLSEALSRRIGLTGDAHNIEGPPVRKALRHLFHLLIALLFGANLIWYFITPYDFFPLLLQGNLGTGARLTWLITTLVIFIDLSFISKLMCKEFCPYGRFQMTLMDSGTLILRFHPDESSRCIRCNACVRACPMGIDIRRGFQIECINCGQCLDACRKVMAGKNQTGIIRYTFGTGSLGAKALLNTRVVFSATAFLLVTTGLILTLWNRPAVSLKLSRAPHAPSQTLADGSVTEFFYGYLTNRSGLKRSFNLQVSQITGETIPVLGPVRNILLAPGEKRRIDFAFIIPGNTSAASTPLRVEIQTEGKKEAVSVLLYTGSPKEH